MLAAAIRLLRISAREPWLDEACTAWFAGGADFGEVIERLAADAHPPLYYLLMHVWTGLFGVGDVALRLPSVIASVALVPVVAWIVAEAGGGRGAQLFAAVGAALSPWLVYYGVETRAYALLALISGVVLAALMRAAWTGSRRAWLVAAVSTSAALYVHHYGIFLLPLWLLAVIGAVSETKRFGALVGTLAVASWVPWAWVWLAGQSRVGGAWLGGFWHGPVDALAGSLRVLALVPPFPDHLGELGLVELPLPIALAVGLVFAVPAGVGAVVPLLMVRHDRERASLLPRVALPTAALLLPTVGAVLVSLSRPIFLAGRYDLMAAPAWLALGAIGVEVIGDRLADSRQRRFAIVAVVVATLCLCTVLIPFLRIPAGPRAFTAAATQIAAAAPGDAVVVVGLARAPLELQLSVVADSHHLESFPASIADHPGWMDRAHYGIEPMRRDVAALAARLADYDGVWLVAELDDRGGFAEPRLAGFLFAALRATGREPGAPQAFGGVGLSRFARQVR